MKPFSYYFESGDIRKVRQLINNENIKTNMLNKYFEISCINKHFEICNYLISLKGKKQIDLEKAFVWCCENGIIEFVKLINTLCDVDEYYKEYCFKAACNKGHLDVVKWTYETFYIRNGILLLAFHLACVDGHLNIAQWLITLDNFVIADYENVNNTLYSVCLHGHFKVAKWLVNIFHNIYVIDRTCDILLYFKRYEMIKWFISQGYITSGSCYYKNCVKIIEEEKKHFINGFICMLHYHNICNDLMLDMNIFAIELPKYLFYK